MTQAKKESHSDWIVYLDGLAPDVLASGFEDDNEILEDVFRGLLFEKIYEKDKPLPEDFEEFIKEYVKNLK